VIFRLVDVIFLPSPSLPWHSDKIIPGMEKKLLRHAKELYRGETLERRAKEFANDPELLDLKNEIGVARALLERELRKNASLQVVLSLLRIVGDLISRQSQIMEKKQYTVHIDLVKHEVEQIVNIIYETLPEDKALYLANLIENQTRLPTRRNEPSKFDTRPGDQEPDKEGKSPLRL